MPRPVDSDEPSHPRLLSDASVLPSVYVKTLGVRIDHFEAVPALQGARLPYGLQDSLPTLRLSCSYHLSIILRHRPKA